MTCANVSSFGCLLYEMVTGARAFGGDEITDTIAAIITKEPDWAKLPPDAPATVHRLLRRCLEKDRGRRLADVHDARLDLEESLDRREPEPRPASPPAHSSARWSRTLPWSIAAVAVIALVGVLARSTTRPIVPSAAPLRLSAALGTDATLFSRDGTPSFVLSPDGTRLAFTASRQGVRLLYLRRLDQLDSVALTGTDGAYSPFFSPDGQWLAFFAGGRLKKISVTGGAAIELADADAARGGTWGPDGTIIFAPITRARLATVPSEGGTQGPVSAFKDAEVAHRWPQFLPGGKAVLFTAHDNSQDFDDANLVVQTLADGARKTIVRGGYSGRYVPSGHLVYVHNGTLFAAPFSVDRLEVTGPAMPAINAVTTNLLRYGEAGDLDTAFEHLDRAIEGRDPALVHLAVAPQWDILRVDPRFTQRLARMGLTPARGHPNEANPGGSLNVQSGRRDRELPIAVVACPRNHVYQANTQTSSYALCVVIYALCVKQRLLRHCFPPFVGTCSPQR